MSLDVAIRWQGGSFALDVVFRAGAGTTVLFGESGAGKTTVLDSIAGLRTPQQGSIALDEVTLFDSAKKQCVKPERRRIGYVQQSLALFPHLTALENVVFGMREPRRERAALAAAWLERVGVSARARARPAQLSGGERQRVAIARALATGPRLLLLDEPFSALDAKTKFALTDDLRDWIPPQIPVLFVTHDLTEAFALGDRVVEIAAGRIVAQGTPDAVVGDGRDRLIARLQRTQKPIITGSG